MKYSITREEKIPHVDEHWIILQMVAFNFSVTVEWEIWDSREKIEAELEDAFEKQREKVSLKNPLIKRKEKQISLLLTELKKKISEQEYKQLVIKAKNL